MMSKFNVTLVLLLVSMSVFITGCPKVSGSGTATVTCPVGQRCTRQGSVTITITPHEEFGQSENYAGIFDLPNEWVAVENPASQVTVKIRDGNGQFVEQTFSLTKANFTEAAPVDKDTTPVAYNYSNPTLVNNFFNSNSTMLASSGSDVEMNFSVSIMRADCHTPGGKYPAHIRFQNSSGITYIQTLTFNYTAPLNVQSGCDEGDLEIEL